MVISIERAHSEKSKKDYNVLVADLGYTKQSLSFDDSVMILLSNLTPQAFYEKLQKVGDKIVVISNDIKK